MMRRLVILGCLIFSCIVQAGTCPKGAPISFGVYQYQNGYTAIIIVDDGKGSISSIEKPNVGIGFFDDTPAITVDCKDYGNIDIPMKHIIACTYPTKLSCLLTIVAFDSTLSDSSTCNNQLMALLTNAIVYSNSTTDIAQCKHSSITDSTLCTTLVQNAIMGKIPEKKKVEEKPPTPPTPDASKDCVAPNIYDKPSGKCTSALQPSACGDSKVTLLDGSCGTACGTNQVQKMGKCQCVSGFKWDVKSAACITDPTPSTDAPLSSTVSTGGGSCSLIRE